MVQITEQPFATLSTKDIPTVDAMPWIRPDLVEPTAAPSPLETRIQELTEQCKAQFPNHPEWYITLCVENYIREEESHLLEKPSTDNVVANADETHKN